MQWIQTTDLLPQALRRRAEENPDRVYLTHVDGTAVSYRQSYDATLQWAAALHRVGVRRDSTVLSMLPNGFDTYHAWIGMAWLGAVEVTLNTAYRGDILVYTINTAAAEVLVVAERFLPQLAEVENRLSDTLRTIVVPDATGAPLPSFERRVLTGADFFTDSPAPADELIEPQPWDTSCIIWTSGTTGPSKGVMLPWAEFYKFCQVITDVTTEDDVHYHFLPAFHVGGKILWYSALSQGSTLVLRESFSSSNFWNDVRKHGVTHVTMQSPMANMLMGAPPTAQDADNPLQHMSCAPLPDTLDAFMERFGISGVNTYYGMTEIGLPFASDGYRLANLQTCGKLRPEYEARIVDSFDYPVEPGTPGELIVRANHPWIMNAGYFGMPKETAEAWRNGWFHTGDAFRVDEDGNYYFVDRVKDALRRRGENISSFEVEAYVAGHPDVVEAAAVGVPSELGEDDVKVVVVRRDGADLTAGALIDWLTPHMPRFMLPRYVEFTDSLPRTTATLKVQKSRLRAAGVNQQTWDRENNNNQ